jgi:hypothetical protein
MKQLSFIDSQGKRHIYNGNRAERRRFIRENKLRKVDSDKK